MLLVDHYVAKSEIHGLGVFSAEDLGAGEALWVFNELVDREIPEERLPELPNHVRDKIYTHAWHRAELKCFWLSADGDYFMNHSDTPTLELREHSFVASRNIKIGDELTCDYRVVKVAAFDPSSSFREVSMSEV